ncbi:MAG: hypothetical protein ACRER2_02445, partial [Methylococcales bacterium]
PATRKPGKSVGVVCHAIRNRALDWLFSDVPAGALLERLTQLFPTNPCLERRQRNPPRKKTSTRTLLDFYRRRKKHRL